MKSDIQQQLLGEIEEFGEEEARTRQRERVMNQPDLGPFLRAKTARDTIEQNEKAS